MAEALKNMFNKAVLEKIAKVLKKQDSKFQNDEFIQSVFDSGWENKELKERMRHITLCCGKYLAQDYSKAIDTLKRAAPELGAGFEFMFFPDFVEVYGLDNWDKSIEALAHFTEYSSSEFAIRPFIIQDQERAFEELNIWAKSDNFHQRRWASEGCRPRLPWAMALPKLKKDPSPIFPLIEQLMNYEEEYVRRSVANNLNDISKDHPNKVLEYTRKWKGKSKNIDRILKHACRSLLKDANTEALLLFGYDELSKVKIENFSCTDSLSIGEDLNFSFQLTNEGNIDKKLRLEYLINYQKSGGKMSKKVFQLSEKLYSPGTHEINRKQSFQQRSTRKHYPGPHMIEIRGNGKILLSETFLLKA